MPPKRRSSRKTTRTLPLDTDFPQMEPLVYDSDLSPDTDHLNTETRRSMRKRKKVCYTEIDDDSDSDQTDTDHPHLDEGDHSDSELGQAHPHSDHTDDGDNSAHSNDTDHSNSDDEPTSDPDHHSAGQVEDEDDQLSPRSTHHSADKEKAEYTFDAPPSPSPPPPRLILTYGDRVMEYVPTTPLPHMAGAPVTFNLYMQHGDGPLHRVKLMANIPPTTGSSTTTSPITTS
ncbi:sarcoplasmic reticulum histidine-rich calcium-binding protein-like [Folsomia candida]|uniref:Uncharacterized protein n=1 Tax=Folsomia candida TaxID=158441 RepID=A0A226DFY1_FOLCA|nr:sarcoplasmic reticulum histidine-rich calcium-binding protein-like [Folsomia candida]OXA43481.1 hypothetical protein Fcan01_21885 [Folsomia candida]